MALANVDSPNGFRPYKWGGKGFVKRVRRVVASGRSKDLMVGDAYKLDSSGQASRATADDDVIRGIVETIDLAPKSGEGPESQDYIPAADAGAIVGIEDPDVLFEVQSTTAAVTDIGKDVDISDADGNTTLAQSRQQVLGSSLGSGDQFRFMEPIDRPDNSYGAFCRIAVRLLQTL